MAMRKISKEFVEAHFEDKNNPLTQDLVEYILSRQISYREEL